MWDLILSLINGDTMEPIISGETGDTLMITNVMESDSGEYECIVTNQFGDTNTSNTCNVEVTSELTIVW